MHRFRRRCASTDAANARVRPAAAQQRCKATPRGPHRGSNARRRPSRRRCAENAAHLASSCALPTKVSAFTALRTPRGSVSTHARPRAQLLAQRTLRVRRWLWWGWRPPAAAAGSRWDAPRARGGAALAARPCRRPGACLRRGACGTASDMASCSRARARAKDDGRRRQKRRLCFVASDRCSKSSRLC